MARIRKAFPYDYRTALGLTGMGALGIIASSFMSSYFLVYLSKHPVISLQSAWEEEPRKYVLISLFDASLNKGDESYIKITRFRFENGADKQAFIDEMCARSMFEIPLDADASDQLVILVTCSYSHDNGRFLFLARELRADETEEGIADLFTSLP